MICSCMRCHHRWKTRTEEKPRTCPSCNSAYWDTPRRKDLANYLISNKIFR